MEQTFNLSLAKRFTDSSGTLRDTYCLPRRLWFNSAKDTLYGHQNSWEQFLLLRKAHPSAQSFLLPFIGSLQTYKPRNEWQWGCHVTQNTPLRFTSGFQELGKGIAGWVSLGSAALHPVRTTLQSPSPSWINSLLFKPLSTMQPQLSFPTSI